jgi:PucR-like helix-turn-helix protein/diguanylate cyclase with GGDEF domain
MRAELTDRVRARRGELEGAIFARVRDAGAVPAGEDDPGYLEGLRAAVAAAIEYGLAGVEHGEERTGPVPPEAILQAHRAARAGVSLDTVLRRYVIGSTVLGDFLMQEADRGDFPDHGATLREMLSAQAAVLDRLMKAVTNEYRRELEDRERSPERRRAERVQRLLAGGTCDSAELGYEMYGWHVGAIATGLAPACALRAIADELGSGLLCVLRGEEAAWGWIGGGCKPAVRELERTARAHARTLEVRIALGEPGWGVEGWRLTHLQAQAALRVALRDAGPVTRYADVALLASLLRDDALAGSLVEIYLSPLGERSNGGAVLRETLRAYFAAERNASSAASALGVARHTVEKRLRVIEEKLGVALRTRQAELEVALRLEELSERELRLAEANAV